MWWSTKDLSGRLMSCFVCVVCTYVCVHVLLFGAYRRSSPESMFALIQLLQPSHISLEEVAGFLGIADNSAEKVEMVPFAQMVPELLSKGYQLDMRLLDAANYGCPQTRVRVILLAAHTRHVLPTFPKPRYQGEARGMPRRSAIFHQEHWERIVLYRTIRSTMELERMWESLPPSVTAKEAIEDLPCMGPDNANLERRPYTTLSPGPYPRLMRSRCKHSTILHHNLPRLGSDDAKEESSSALKRMNAGAPSSTTLMKGWPFPAITTSVASQLRTDGDRQLSIAELKRAQSLPDEMELCGCLQDKRLMIANAVPPMLAWEIGAAMLKACGLPSLVPPQLK
eukprot:jgi/Mesvir1/26308/Mv26042-RA.2